MREECSKEKARFGYDHPEDFFICFWQKDTDISNVWVLYRAAVLLYLCTAIIVVVILRDAEDSPWYKNPIFYYYWVSLAEFFTLALAFIIVVQRYWQQKKSTELPPMEKMPWHFKLLWVLYTVSTTCATVVTVVFFLFLYSKGEHPYLKYTVVTHVSQTVIMIIDFSVAAIPVRLLHIYLPFLFTCSYGIFSLIYQKSGGTGNQGKIPIYKVLDWRDPLTAMEISLLHLVILVIVYCGYYSLYLLKLYFKKKAGASKEPDI